MREAGGKKGAGPAARRGGVGAGRGTPAQEEAKSCQNKNKSTPNGCWEQRAQHATRNVPRGKIVVLSHDTMHIAKNHTGRAGVLITTMSSL